MKMAIEVTTDLNTENTKLVLDGLSRCRGIDNCYVYVHVDDGCPGMLDMLRNHPLKHVRFLKAFRIGRDCNVYAAMEHGFQNADYVVHLDDTAVPHEDFLDMHKFCASEFRSRDNDVMAVSSLGNICDDDHSEEFNSQYQFSNKSPFDPFGFGTWRHCWRDFLRDGWHGNGQWYENISGHGLQVYPNRSCCDIIPAKTAVAA